MDRAGAELILNRLPLISGPQARMMHALWESGDARIRQRAWQRGKQALRAQRAEPLYESANNAVSRWIRDHATGNLGQPYEVYGSFSDQNRLETRIAAAPPILDAILGTLVADVFPADELDELMGPWSMAMEEDGGPGDAGPAHPAPRGDTHP
jgi:hypothetical protein